MFDSARMVAHYMGVKLNNPLMGTETEKEKAVKNATNSEVKLNNPLMGTETYCKLYSI